MKMTVRNKKLSVKEVEIGGVGGASLVLVGDTEEITTSAMFDTPSDSLIVSPEVPVKPIKEDERDGGN
ncbi:MAG: hypothetical protein H0Z33_07595 [Bacillaceae bacterium]|nr:hypothetical protein [Bacillaceae bacterium]